MTKPFLFTLLICSALLVMTHTPASVAAQAQDTGEDSSAKPPAERPADNKEATQTETKTAANSAKRAKENEIFRPSEEISEDFAVSFPVDI